MEAQDARFNPKHIFSTKFDDNSKEEKDSVNTSDLLSSDDESPPIATPHQ